MRDAGHYLRVLKEQPGVLGERFGAVGYCIGGRLAFATAGSHPKEIAAAASVHGGSIATDAPDSPHLAAGHIEARLYFAIADEDRSCTPEQQGKLAVALAAAHVDFTVEHLRGARMASRCRLRCLRRAGLRAAMGARAGRALGHLATSA